MYPPPPSVSDSAQKRIHNFHLNVIETVSKTVASNKVVVIGMATNPYVKKVKNTLSKANIEYEYLNYGGYLSQWPQRLAIKIWSGWPTFPQVFVNGVLIGGSTKTKEALENGIFQELLEKPRE